MRPTKVAHASFNEATRLSPERGSFWGNVRTAAWYAASDVVERNPFCRPLLVAVASTDLLNECELYPDRASLEAPVIEHDPNHRTVIVPRWYQDYETLGWEQSIVDIGAVYAVHDDHIRPQSLSLINSSKSFAEFRDKIDATLTHTSALTP